MSFIESFLDELEKIAAFGKGSLTKQEKARFGPKGMGKKAGSIKAKIEAARRDPSTKANPKDTGPAGSGLQDPRAKMQQIKMRLGKIGR